MTGRPPNVRTRETVNYLVQTNGRFTMKQVAADLAMPLTTLSRIINNYDLPVRWMHGPEASKNRRIDPSTERAWEK